MPTSRKLPSQERRADIIRSVRRLFAEKGFHGVTTRELAQAANVSEALLFRHFPNKEALYAAMLSSYSERVEHGPFEGLAELPPSTATLVRLVEAIISHVARKSADEEDQIQQRLMFRSILEDGEFARFFLQGLGAIWIAKVEESLRAAIASGDALPGTDAARLSGWFTHHLAVMLMLSLRMTPSLVDYGVPQKKLVEHAVRFVLRGMGLNEAAIKRYFPSKAELEPTTKPTTRGAWNKRSPNGRGTKRRVRS